MQTSSQDRRIDLISQSVSYTIRTLVEKEVLKTHLRFPDPSFLGGGSVISDEAASRRCKNMSEQTSSWLIFAEIWEQHHKRKWLVGLRTRFHIRMFYSGKACKQIKVKWVKYKAMHDWSMIILNLKNYALLVLSFSPLQANQQFLCLTKRHDKTVWSL